MDRDQAQRLVAQVLPSYEVMELLGEGSFGAVYRIKDSLKERAVKVIQLNATASIEKGEVASGGVKIERDFRHIVDNYEKIACDEIVTVYDFYKILESDDRNQATAYAIVIMELYPNNLLDFTMSHFTHTKNLFDFDTVSVIMEKLAILTDNLYEKHGFLFEDLKPENILVKKTGSELKLVVGDIGGLKSLRSVSATGSQVTLSYCAAEVLRSRQKPDIRSIIYSYGLISYFVLEGHLPYEDAPVTDRIDLIREKGLVFDRAAVPDYLKETIKKCLAFDPQDRFQKFGDVIDALRRKAAIQQSVFSGQTINLDSFVAPEPAPAVPVRNPNAPFGGMQRAGGTVSPFSGARSPFSQRLMPSDKRNLSVNKISTERRDMDKIEVEVCDLIVKSGDLHRIQNQSIKVINDIKVEKGGLLIIEDSKLFFEENVGIYSSGTLRAKNSIFAALDVKKRWANISLNPLESRVSSIEGCKFRFGGGRTWSSLKKELHMAGYPLNDTYSYGGALFVAESRDKLVIIADTSFYNCTANEGGGIFCLKAHASIVNSSFENCSATLCGGGINTLDSHPLIKNCKFHSCLSHREGGGMFFKTSKPSIEKCIFENCSTRYLFGGGIYCFDSDAAIKDCKFNRCSASKDGGGIYCNSGSRPNVMFPSFSNCLPNNSNVGIHG